MAQIDRDQYTFFNDSVVSTAAPQLGAMDLAKRAFDIVGALGLLMAFSPLFALIWILAKIDGGPAVFAHKRVGRDGRQFYCLKFRTMVVNAGEMLEEILANDPEAKVEWDALHKITNDPRITKIGHFLRKTSLDELPQVFNVLRGEMSLVGPRPVVTDEIPRYGQFAAEAFSVRPGITGLWQIGGRNDISYDERVQNDISYVRNRSLLGDVAILFATVKVVLFRTGK